jgi:hypothetical protein
MVIVSIAQSIRFYWDNDTSLPNIDNQPYRTVFNKNYRHKPFFQKYYNTDEVTIQVKSTSVLSVNNPVMTAHFPDGSSSNIAIAWSVGIGSSFYFEFDIDFSTFAFTHVWFKIVTVEDSGQPEEATFIHKSNVIEILPKTSQYLRSLQWSNSENEFEVIYNNDIEHRMRIPGSIELGDPAGDQETYDNLDEVVNLLDEVKRIMEFETEFVPDMVAEQIRIAIAHDQFFIDEVQYTRTSLPQYINGENTNLKAVKAELAQKSIIGLNTHDSGYECPEIDENMDIVLEKTGATGDFSDWIVSDGYLAGYLTLILRGGSNIIIDIGTTPAGTDVLNQLRLTTTDFAETIDLTRALGADGDQTLYVSIAGGSPEVDFKLITFKNKQ